MEARVELVRSGDRTQTSCTHERTCVGAANALTNWASQTEKIQDGQEFNWVQSRYLGIIVESATASHFQCNISDAKKSFYHSFNAIFGRVGRIAKENVTVELLIKKCLPTLLYATEVCLLNKSDIRALDYVVDSALKKIFDTNSKEITLEYRELIFDFEFNWWYSFEKAT